MFHEFSYSLFAPFDPGKFFDACCRFLRGGGRSGLELFDNGDTMFFKFACRVVRIDLRDKLDASFFVRFDNVTDGTNMLLDDCRDFRSKFSTCMEPKNLETSHDSFVRIAIAQFLKGASLLFRIIRSQHVDLLADSQGKNGILLNFNQIEKITLLTLNGIF